MDENTKQLIVALYEAAVAARELNDAQTRHIDAFHKAASALHDHMLVLDERPLRSVG